MLVEIEIFVGAMKGAVGCIGRDIREEWRVLVCGFLDEVVRGTEENVCAEALGGNDFSVMKVVSIKVGVVPEIGCLANAAAAVAIDFGEAAIFGAVGVVVAEVPLSEHSRGVFG